MQGSGAHVYGVAPHSPADKVLTPGDVVVQAAGQPIQLATDLSSVVINPGGSLPLTVERGNDRVVVVLKFSEWRFQADPTGDLMPIGVYADTRALGSNLPFTVVTRPGHSGPSGGLASALVLVDALSAEDLAQGRTIAATGTIDPEGHVGLIGGVQQKAIAAKRAGAAIFLVPAGQARSIHVNGLVVREVSSLSDALMALRS